MFNRKPKMTEGQKRYWRQIEEMEAEGMIDDRSKQRNRERKGVRSKPAISLVTVAFIVWNTFAVYTWVAPIISRTLGNRDSSAIVSDVGKVSKANKKQVKYLEERSEVVEFTNSINDKLDNTRNGVDYPSGNIAKDISRIDDYVSWAINNEYKDTDLSYTLYQSLVSYKETLLEYDISVNGADGGFYVDKVNTLIGRNAELSHQVNKDTIAFLEDNGLDYKIKDDGYFEYYK